ARLGLGAEEAGVAAMRTDRWAFVHFQRGDPILVDPVADPAWTRNRAAEPGAQPVLLSALRAMLDLRARAVDKRLSGCRLTKGGPRGRYDPLPASFATLVR
ncbi:MAG: hypothetical protein NZ555_12960, partial [Geminicoccaceae bacterium]|nr:hypothetical protein [Geminicoccaceae bacterium]